MPVLHRKNVTQPCQAVGTPGRPCREPRTWLGADLPSASLYWSVLTKNLHWPLRKVILKPDLLPAGPSYWKKPFIFLSLTKGLPISSLIYLWLIYPHYVLAPPITSISIFVFQLWILKLELLKPAPIFLWGTDSSTSGSVVNNRKNIPNFIPILIWLQFCAVCTEAAFKFCMHFNSSSPNNIKFWMIFQHPYHHSLPLTPVITIYFLLN